MQSSISLNVQRPSQVNTTLAALVSRHVERLQVAFGSIPPGGLVLLSSFAIQLGTVVAKQLFDTLGPMGAAFLCKAFGAFLLLILYRPSLRNHSWNDYVRVLCLGMSIAGMSLAFYGAVARIPLGIASTLDFVGPLSVAVAGSRRLIDLVWVALAAIGVVLLAPLSNTAFDPVGIAFGLLSAAFWAGFILVSASVGRAFPGGAGLALALAIATVILLPFGVQQGGAALVHPAILLVGFGAALLSTVLPYALEFKALNQLPPRVFGVLISIEPAIAALVGFLFLGESLGLRSLTAVVLVTIAAIRVTCFSRSNSPH
jgi:inner membrane transporter RhtA